MKKIRILAFLLAVSLAMSIGASAAYLDGFSWSVTGEKSMLNAGESMQVTVYLAPGQDFYEYNSAEIYIKWNPKVFAVSDVKGLNLFKATLFSEDAVPHIFANRYTNSTTNMLSWPEEKPVVSFTVTALQSGSGEVTLYQPQITQTVQYMPVPIDCRVSSPLRVTVTSGQAAQGGYMQTGVGDSVLNPAGDPNESQQPIEKPAKITSFADVPSSHWAHDAVSFCTELGLFTGTSATTFSPEAPVTRGMFMTVLARAAGADTEGGATWYEKGQQWAMENEVSDGTNPELPLTREQLVTMLYRFGGSPMTDGSIAEYPDAADASTFSYDALCWASKYGIINGVNGMLSPKTGATRAQLAAILMRWSMLEY